MARIYLLREHIQVGDELIHLATTDGPKARALAREMRTRTGTRSWDVVGVDDAEPRVELSCHVLEELLDELDEKAK